MDRRRQRQKHEAQEGTEEKKVMSFFLHSCSIPLFFQLIQLPLCATARELEVIASAFHRQAPVHSSEQLPANRQPRRKSSSPASPQECISRWFASRTTPPLLTPPQTSRFHSPLLDILTAVSSSSLPPPFFSPSLPLSLPALSVMQLVALKVPGCFGGGSGSLRSTPKCPL
ncbi:hypothetical protein ILYODFUR_015523 [Ilyodon furcidens]|uniref:Uncharacterized protein n=1 Tax=Ilyodon furcidens TaxID=33524 RepID=A0ABV0U6A5_9TELE